MTAHSSDLAVIAGWTALAYFIPTCLYNLRRAAQRRGYYPLSGLEFEYRIHTYVSLGDLFNVFSMNLAVSLPYRLPHLSTSTALDQLVPMMIWNTGRKFFGKNWAVNTLGGCVYFKAWGADANVCGYLTVTWTETLLIAAALSTLIILKSVILVALIQQGQRRDGWRRIIPLLAFFWPELDYTPPSHM